MVSGSYSKKKSCMLLSCTDVYSRGRLRNAPKGDYAALHYWLVEAERGRHENEGCGRSGHPDLQQRAHHELRTCVYRHCADTEWDRVLVSLCLTICKNMYAHFVSTYEITWLCKRCTLGQVSMSSRIETTLNGFGIKTSSTRCESRQEVDKSVCSI